MKPDLKLPDLSFCPACGEPAARRSRGDDFECANCHAAIEMRAWIGTPPEYCACGVKLVARASQAAKACVFCRKDRRAAALRGGAPS